MKSKLLFLLFTFAFFFNHAFAQNVGIGTTTPQAKLHVNGDFRLKNGAVVNTISADSSFSPGSDTILPTQKAIKRFLQKGNWLNGTADLVFLNSNSSNLVGTNSLCVQGNYAYVAAGNKLCIFDISDPNSIVAKGFTSTNLSSVYSVSVQGNYAYVTDAGNSRLCIFDISDPNNIVAKAFIATNPYFPLSVAVQGNYAYVTTTEDALRIYDISNPNSIVAKGSTSVNIGLSHSICVRGNYVYVASQSTDNLAIYDVSDPNNIIVKGTTTTNLDDAYFVYVQGNYAYVASYLNNRLCIFDISNPNSIVAKGFTSANLNTPTSVYVQGNYAYVTSLFISKQLSVFDVSDPNNIIAKTSIASSVNGGGVVVAQGNYAYVMGSSSLQSYSYEPAKTISFDATGNLSLVSSPWEISENDIFRINGNVGIGVSVPRNKLDVDGNAVIGSTYAGISTSPLNGLLIEGNVGIGVTDPANKLSISGGITVDRALANTGTITNTIKFGAENSGEGVGSKKNPGGNQNGLDFYTNYINRMSITNGGFVGIGTTTPTVPLEVGTNNSISVANYGYLASNGNAGFTSGAFTVPVSIRAATGRIVGIEFNAVSDERIKRNIQTSSSQNDLTTLLKLRVADYQLKDSIYNGNGKVKGLIAQELKSILPQAVHTNTDFVPDIYCLSTSTEYNEKDKTLKVSLCKPHGLKTGDKVKLFAGDGVKEQYVSAIGNETTFTVNNWEIKQAGMNPITKVFVWGKQVNDFHTVDYNQVFSLGISAIQQLAKENDALKIEIEQIKDQLKTKSELLQQQIDELKKLFEKQKNNHNQKS